jgi:hypothetical protein
LVDFFRNVVFDWTVILCFDWPVVYEMELSDWFLFLYSDWWMSDRLKYSYSVPLRTPDTVHIEDILQMAARMVDIQPLKRALGVNIYLELTEWNGSKRVDLRFRKDGTVPTKEGVSLSSGSLSSNNGMICFSSFHSPKCKATPLLVGR